MQVTASILYDLVHCPQRVALDAFGDPARKEEENAFVRLLWERGHLYEIETIRKVELPFTDLSGVKANDRERLTLEAMKRGDPLIYSGLITSGDLLGIPDLLRKEVGGYVAGDIKSGAGEETGRDEGEGKPKVHYAVQLALYVDILEKLGMSAGRYAFVWDIREGMSRTTLHGSRGRKNRKRCGTNISRPSRTRAPFCRRGRLRYLRTLQSARSAIGKAAVWTISQNGTISRSSPSLAVHCGTP